MRRARRLGTLWVVVPTACFVALVWFTAFGDRLPRGPVAVENGSVLPAGGELEIRYDLRNNSADSLTVSSVWSLSPASEAPRWNDRVFEGEQVSGAVSAGRTANRSWSGVVDVPPGDYTVTVWTRELRNGEWRPSGSRDIGTFSRKREGSVLRFRPPSGVRVTGPQAVLSGRDLLSARVTAQVSNDGPDEATVIVLWGLQQMEANPFRSPLVPSGSPVEISVPPNSTVSIDLTGRAAPPVGIYSVRMVVRLPVVPADIAGPDAAVPYSVTGPDLDDLMLTEPAVRALPDTTIERDKPPAGPLAVTAVRFEDPDALGENAQSEIAFVVANLSSETRAATATVELESLGGEVGSESVRSASRSISVGPGSSQEFVVPVDLPDAQTVGLSIGLHGADPATKRVHVDAVTASHPLRFRR